MLLAACTIAFALGVPIASASQLVLPAPSLIMFGNSAGGRGSHWDSRRRRASPQACETSAPGLLQPSSQFGGEIGPI